MSGKRISREKLTIKKMIDLYQAKCPQASAEPEHYEALFVYAQKRLDKCVFGEEKPACKQCPVHCYQPAKREEMKQIMPLPGSCCECCGTIRPFPRPARSSRYIPEAVP